MKEFLTPLGKNVIRKLFFDIQVKKKELRQTNDIAGYDFQAIQQREIAVHDLFEQLITFPSKELLDENMPNYYIYLAKENKKPKQFKDNGISWEDYITADGLQKALSLYEFDLIQKESAWHDGVFEIIPKTTKIDEIEKCRVNTNFLERQQGFVIAFKNLKIPARIFRGIEERVRNCVYTSTINENGQNEYKLLASYYDEDNRK